MVAPGFKSEGYMKALLEGGVERGLAGPGVRAPVWVGMKRPGFLQLGLWGQTCSGEIRWTASGPGEW